MHVVIRLMETQVQYIFIVLHCILLGFYLDLFLYVVKDESLGVNEVVGGVQGDSVQWAAVNTASIYCPASGFGPD